MESEEERCHVIIRLPRIDPFKAVILKRDHGLLFSVVGKAMMICPSSCPVGDVSDAASKDHVNGRCDVCMRLQCMRGTVLLR